MDSNEAQSCLKTFLETSKFTIDARDREIRRLERQKSIAKVSEKSLLNKNILDIIRKRDKIQGRLDSVRLEMLDMILDNPSLVSEKLIKKKGYDTVTSFVQGEKESIELRGLYQENPCSIREILNVALSIENVGGKIEASQEDIKSAVNDRKVVKTMIKIM